MIYLDNAATSWPKPETMYRTIDEFMRRSGANPGRSGHRMSIDAGRAVYGAREALAELFHVPDPLRIVFTKNATESLNLVMSGILRPGDHAITSSMEHNSVMRPLRALEQKGIELTVIQCSPQGTLDPRN
ncbi:MAG: aminotransferase class V-fold PLP-dependent enzyme, partial [Chloroflexi bacterium]|nr:aminotransferase class V-fold PLP-dependent enzyme [Chloroflexota bacterium]